MHRDLRNRTLLHRSSLNSARLMRGYPTIRTAIMVELIILSLLTVATLSASGQSYNLKYDLGFVGTLYAGGVISIVSNFTNSQLTIRIAGILFASDFWSNGTRDISLGPSFYLTAGMMKEVDTLVPIPPNAFIGNHNIDATADWQYSNSSGWFNATPIQTNKAGSGFSDYWFTFLQFRNDTVDWSQRRWSGYRFDCNSSVWTEEDSKTTLPLARGAINLKTQSAFPTRSMS